MARVAKIPSRSDIESLITQLGDINRDAELLMEKMHSLEMEFEQLLTGTPLKDRLGSIPADELTSFCNRIESINQELVSYRNEREEPEKRLRHIDYDLFV